MKLIKLIYFVDYCQIAYYFNLLTLRVSPLEAAVARAAKAPATGSCLFRGVTVRFLKKTITS